MSIVNDSGLLAAVAYVQTFLTTKGVDAKCELGWKRRQQQLNQGGPLGGNRVIFVPSDGTSGGKIVPARFPGPRSVHDPAQGGKVVGTQRSLRDWERAVSVSVWAVDAADRTNESKQISATEALFEWVVRAVHSAPGAFGAVSWGAIKWTPPPERSFGLELVAPLTFKQPLFDEPRLLVFPSAVAVRRGEYTNPTAPSSDGDT